MKDLIELARELPPLPEPKARLRWDSVNAVYKVNRPNIDSTDIYSDSQMREYAEAAIKATLERIAELEAAIAASAQDAARLTDKQIEAGWHQTFSTSNPFCPCDLRAFKKAVNWAQSAIKEPKP